MRSTTTKPFGDALRELKDARGLTYDALAETTRRLDGKGITGRSISRLANGHGRPSLRAIELLARACGVQPHYFAEYRLAEARKRAALKSSTTIKPFGEALRELKDAHGLTYRVLAETTRKLDGRGMTHAHINMLANGREKPSKRAIELLARACCVQPDYFAEYRLAASRKHGPLNQLADAIGTTSTKPFKKAVRELKNARGLTYRDIVEQSRKLDGKGITRSYLNVLINDHERPSTRAIDLIAQGCGVQPDYFAEYRLGMARRKLDPAQVGLEQALENLNSWQDAHRGGGTKARATPPRQDKPRRTR
jgi:transcriptional regulator with XRE-family HTH domain